MKVEGILLSEEEDANGFKHLINGLCFSKEFIESGMPIVNNNGQLLGNISTYLPVYRAITDASVELAMKADLVEAVPQDKDENALTGTTYLQLKYPFLRIQANLVDHIILKEAIEAGNLYFGFNCTATKQISTTLFKYNIDKVVLTISPTQKCSKIYLCE